MQGSGNTMLELLEVHPIIKLGIYLHVLLTLKIPLNFGAQKTNITSRQSFSVVKKLVKIAEKQLDKMQHLKNKLKLNWQPKSK